MENINKIINVTVIGHVDCGKSTLCGQLLLSCGLVTEQEILKLKMIAKENKLESWYLAYLRCVVISDRICDSLFNIVIYFEVLRF